MNRTFGQIFNSLVVLALGVALIAMHNEIRLMEYMVMLIGIAFIIPSVYSIIGTLYYRKKGLPAYYSTAGLVSAIGSLCIGVLLLSIPTFFIGFLTYLLAALMVLWGIAHIVALIRSNSTYRYSLWLYIMPTATTIAGVVILASSVKEIQSVVVLITGIAMIILPTWKNSSNSSTWSNMEISMVPVESSMVANAMGRPDLDFMTRASCT